jgi:hypothetical protein
MERVPPFLKYVLSRKAPTPQVVLNIRRAGE